MMLYFSREAHWFSISTHLIKEFFTIMKKIHTKCIDNKVRIHHGSFEKVAGIHVR